MNSELFEALEVLEKENAALVQSKKALEESIVELTRRTEALEKDKAELEQVWNTAEKKAAALEDDIKGLRQQQGLSQGCTTISRASLWPNATVVLPPNANLPRPRVCSNNSISSRNNSGRSKK